MGKITCLDYSPVCIEMVKSMHGPLCPNMEFVVGDSTRLKEVLWDEDAENQSLRERQFDVIVDKGLLDALMCGDGFEIEKLMRNINEVLTNHEWGIHVLVCFQLSKASKQSLVELGHCGDEYILVWDFDIPVKETKKGRACLNLAHRCAHPGQLNEHFS